MKRSDNSYLLMKGFILFGGLFEVVMGAIIIMWGDLIIAFVTQMQVIPNYPLYWRTMGLLAVTLGGLQIIASFQPERYLIVPIAACGVRFVLPILTTFQIYDTPSMGGLLIIATAFDFILAAVTFILLYHNGLLKKNSSNSN